MTRLRALRVPYRLIAALENSTKAASARQVGLRKGEIQAGSLVRRVSYHWRTLARMHTKQPLALKRRYPHLFQDGKGLCNRISFGEDDQGMSRDQLTA